MDQESRLSNSQSSAAGTERSPQRPAVTQPTPAEFKPAGSSPAAGSSQAKRPDDVSRTGPGVSDRARETVGKVANKAGEKLTAQIDEQKNRVAEGLSSLSETLRDSSNTMREKKDGDTVLPGYFENAATQVERLADYLKTADTRQMVTRVEEFARREPIWFIGGAFTLGLLVARFLKSSPQTAGTAITAR